MEIALGLAIVAVALVFAFGKSLRRRNELQETTEERPQKMSKREKKLAEIRANEPDVEIPTIDELITDELSETGVNEIDGHDGLTDPVKLKVYHRDIGKHQNCPPESFQFRLSYGIEAESATIDDVRLVCTAEDHAAREPTGDEPAGDMPRETEGVDPIAESTETGQTDPGSASNEGADAEPQDAQPVDAESEDADQHQ